MLVKLCRNLMVFYLGVSSWSFAFAGDNDFCPGFEAVVRPLQLGQRVSLKQEYGAYEVILTNDGKLIGPYFVEEIASCHIRLVQFAAVEELLIPSNAIRNVKVVFLPPDPSRVQELNKRMQ